MDDISKAKDVVCVAPLYSRALACSDGGAAMWLVVSQSSRAESGESRERKIVSTLSELVANLK